MNMKHAAKSIRAFIGARISVSQGNSTKDLGFEESPIFKSMSYFRVSDKLGFYLQDAYVEDWINNTMIFLEVDDVDWHWKELQNLALHLKYKNVKLTPIREENWGKECFMHDPSGILWHFGEFYEMK